MISIKKVNQHYGGTQILWDLDLDIEPGSRTCIMGRNGVGKSTLLQCMMGLRPITSGEILMGGSPIHTKSAEARAPAGIGYVPQGREIFPLLTVEENLQLGLPIRAQRLGKEEAKEIPQKIFDLFPVLGEMMHRRGGDLSGGQQQQLAIARALVINPDFLILDEPTEGIQPSIIQEIGRTLRRLVDEFGMSVLLVEQYYDFARRIADRYVVMSRGEVIAQGDGANMEADGVRDLVAV